MKSSYELAMERLARTAPTVKLTQAQKKELAELDSRYAARVAERELTLKDEIATATADGNLEQIEKLSQQLQLERRRLLAELEEKKDQVRQASAK
jgi:hypothetical protein